MRILTPELVCHFMGRLINIHPSLLPAYPGLNTHQRAIEAGDKEAGATVHFVTPELDDGPSILQATVTIDGNDNAQTLAAKVLKVEHMIYPVVVQWFVDGRLSMNDGVAYLDKQPIAKQGIMFTPDREPQHHEGC